MPAKGFPELIIATETTLSAQTEFLPYDTPPGGVQERSGTGIHSLKHARLPESARY